MMPSSLSPRFSRGFTLIETLLAIGVITIMIFFFLAAFAPAVEGIGRSLTTMQANRIASAVESELERVNNTENYKDSVEKAHYWIEQSMQGEAFLLYTYKADINASKRADDTLPVASPKTDKLPGQDYVLETVIRPIDSSYLAQELRPGVVVGRVFYLKFEPLVRQDTALEVTQTLQDLDSLSVLPFQVSFYALKSSLYSYAKYNFDTHKPGKVLFTRNMAARR